MNCVLHVRRRESANGCASDSRSMSELSEPKMDQQRKTRYSLRAESERIVKQMYVRERVRLSKAESNRSKTQAKSIDSFSRPSLPSDSLSDSASQMKTESTDGSTSSGSEMAGVSLPEGINETIGMTLASAPLRKEPQILPISAASGRGIKQGTSSREINRRNMDLIRAKPRSTGVRTARLPRGSYYYLIVRFTFRKSEFSDSGTFARRVPAILHSLEARHLQDTSRRN